MEKSNEAFEAWAKHKKWWPSNSERQKRGLAWQACDAHWREKLPMVQVILTAITTGENIKISDVEETLAAISKEMGV
jgi:hypothetical protein